MDFIDYRERGELEYTEIQKLRKAGIKEYLEFSGGIAQLDGEYTAEQLRLIADALERVIKACQESS